MTAEPGGAEFRPPRSELIPISRDAARLGREAFRVNPEQRFTEEMKTLFNSQGYLYRFLMHRSGEDEAVSQDDFASQLSVAVDGEPIQNNSSRRGLYQEGALLAYRSFEEQSRISGTPVPEVSRDVRNQYDLEQTAESAKLSSEIEDPVNIFEESMRMPGRGLQKEDAARELVDAVRDFVIEQREDEDVEDALTGAADVFFMIRNQIESDREQTNGVS